MLAGHGTVVHTLPFNRNTFFFNGDTRLATESKSRDVSRPGSGFIMSITPGPEILPRYASMMRRILVGRPRTLISKLLVRVLCAESRAQLFQSQAARKAYVLFSRNAVFSATLGELFCNAEMTSPNWLNTGDRAFPRLALSITAVWGYCFRVSMCTS